MAVIILKVEPGGYWPRMHLLTRGVRGLVLDLKTRDGQLLTLGEYLYQRCQPGPWGAMTAWRFDGERYDGDADFNWRDQYNVGPLNGHIPSPAANPYAHQLGNQAFQRSRVLQWLWARAMTEWP